MPSGGAANSQSWDAGRKPSTLPYDTMSVFDVEALPVKELAAEDAHLYLWTVNAWLESSYEIVRVWGFKPSQLLVWAKTPRGLGLGGAFTNTTEFVIFGWRGSCNPLERQDSSWWNWKRGPHSAKPEAFMDMVERVSPAPRLEMFARRNRLGWDTFGNEALEHLAIA